MSDEDKKELRQEQLIELRQKQFEMAMNGDVRMLIWLGKQYLGQSEKPEVVTDELCDGFDLEEITEWDGRPISDIVFSECKDEDCKCKDCRKCDKIKMDI